MEEILASIRRIISEDGDAKPADAKPAEPAKPAAPAPAAASPPPPPPPPPPPAQAEPPAAAEEDVLELTEVAEEPPPPPPPRAAPVQAAPTPVDDGLMSANSATAAAAAFASLTDAGGERTMTQPLPIGDGTRTLEDMVREILRPMLKSWLDENLPAMVERMVRSEIERVARRG